MSHFAMRVGHLFHIHPSILGPKRLAEDVKKRRAASAAPRSTVAEPGRDDLAYLGICKEVTPESGRSELAHRGLIPEGTETESRWGPDEIWLSLM